MKTAQYLPCLDATGEAVKNDLLKLRTTSQKKGEKEQEYARRLIRVLSHCSNAHPQHRLMTMFISELLPKIYTLVEYFRERQRKVSYPTLFQHASLEDYALRSQQENAREPSTTPRLITPTGSPSL